MKLDELLTHKKWGIVHMRINLPSVPLLSVALFALTLIPSTSFGAVSHFQVFKNLKKTSDCFRKHNVTCPRVKSERFFSEPVDIVIPEPYWPLITDMVDGPHISFIDPIDFDNDGMMDLVVATDVGRGRNWGPDGPGELFRGNGEETADDLDGASWTSELFLRQTEPGAYEIWNYQLFGEEFIYLGGMGRKRIVGDFNQDGYVDLVRAINREDGRRTTQLSEEGEPYLDNWMTQQKAFISNGNGTYRIDDLGDLVMWGHAITTAKKSNGDQDIVLGSYDNRTLKNPWTGPANAFTYEGDKQREYGDYPWLDAWDIMASDPVDVGDNNYSEYLIDTREFRDSQGEPVSQGYAIFRQVDAAWEPHIQFELSKIVGSIDIYFDDKDTPEGQDNVRVRPLWEHRGMKLVNHTWADSCSLLLHENEAIFVSVSDGTVIPEDHDYSRPLYSGELFGKAYNKFVTAWKIENAEVVILDHIFDEQWDNPQGERFFECMDVNGDGLDDYMSWSSGYSDARYPGTGPDLYPQVYINNGKGDLLHSKIKGLEEIELLPYNPEAEYSTALISRLMDINGDGIGDFVHHIYGRDTLRIQYGLRAQTLD